MCKRILIIAAIVFAVPAMVFALDNTATVNQSGGGTNTTSVTQSDGATATITQVGSTSNSATTNQSGGSGNTLTIAQIGQPSETPATNTLMASQSGGGGNLAWVKQIAANGKNNTIVIAGPPESAGIVQNGNGNTLVGATSSAELDPANPATQNSSHGSNSLRANQQGNNNTIGLYQSSTYSTDVSNRADIDQLNGGNTLVAYQGVVPWRNTLTVDQSGSDSARLYQNSMGQNQAYITQGGNGYADITQGAGQSSYVNVNQGNSSSLDLYQGATSGMTGNNWAQIVQSDSDLIRLSQSTTHDTGYNTADIVQTGNGNNLVGANADGSPNLAGWATQTSATSYNELTVGQSGGDTAGLYQNGGYNDADIAQSGGLNSVGSYQSTTGGYNDLDVTQTGSDTATVVQTGAANNTATINQ